MTCSCDIQMLQCIQVTGSIAQAAGSQWRQLPARLGGVARHALILA